MQKDTGPIDLSGLVAATIANGKTSGREDAAGPAFVSHRGRAALCDWQLKRVVSYLSNRIDSSVRIGDLVSEVNLSAGHFAEHFEAAAAGTIAEGATIEAFVSDDLHDPRAASVLLTGIDVEGPS